MDLLTYCNIKPSFNQIEVHPYLNQKELIEFMLRFNIKTIAYCPLARGGGWCKEKYQFDLLEDDIILKLSKKYNKTPAQICLRWGVQRDYIVIPRSSNRNRLYENININDFNIDKSDIEIINNLNKNFRIVNIEHLKNNCNIPLFL
tara:strand:+ start:22 stop:459 length:438 start_codon:yes stop_codon:yes gene_type:complete